MTRDRLDVRALNRALLARQHLLERSAMPPLAAVEHLVALQAQNPHDPYVALWSRLDRFDAEELSAALAGGDVVRMGLLRTTIHLVTARDAVALWPMLRPVLLRVWNATAFRRDLDGLDVAEVVAAAAEHLARPQRMPDLRAHLAERWPGPPPASLAQAARFHLPLAQLPPRGLWGRTGGVSWQRLDAWLGRPVPDEPDPTVFESLVLRYLAAFGPATAADVRAWSGLAGVAAVLQRLRPRLRTFRDERNRELFDVPDAPLPDGATPAPPRLLPEFDNISLGHDDRTRIVPPEVARRLTGFVGTFLLDGFVAGQWRLDATANGQAVTIVLDPFVPATDDDLGALSAEARRFAAFRTPRASRVDVTVGQARVETPPNS